MHVDVGVYEYVYAYHRVTFDLFDANTRKGILCLETAAAAEIFTWTIRNWPFNGHRLHGLMGVMSMLCCGLFNTIFIHMHTCMYVWRIIKESFLSDKYLFTHVCSSILLQLIIVSDWLKVKTICCGFVNSNYPPTYGRFCLKIKNGILCRNTLSCVNVVEMYFKRIFSITLDSFLFPFFSFFIFKKY